MQCSGLLWSDGREVTFHQNRPPAAPCTKKKKEKQCETKHTKKKQKKEKKKKTIKQEQTRKHKQTKNIQKNLKCASATEGRRVVPSPRYEVVQDSRIMHT